MFNIDYIRENKNAVTDSIKKRGEEVNVEKLIELDDRRRELTSKIDSLRAERNKLSEQNKGGKPDQATIEQAKKIKNELSSFETELAPVKDEIADLLNQVPNLLDESVPAGGEENNQAIKTVNEKPEFDFEVLNHEKLGRNLDLIDLETAAETSGSRFYYLKNDAVRLHYALVSWLLSKYIAKGFTPVMPPVMVRENMMQATGFFPADKNEIYNVNPDDDNLYLIGTAEVPLAGLHMFKPIENLDQPKRYIGISSAFRREAGSYGKDTKGIFRVHQFEKMEMYSFVKPDQSQSEHEYLLSIEEEILQELGLHYQVVNIAAGDLGAPATKKYDCEVWIPSQGRYRELTSCSNTTDFQARRGNIKYRNESGDLEFAHTLNGTAMASTRTLIALMENYQTSDGRIRIPKVLQKFMDDREVI